MLLCISVVVFDFSRNLYLYFMSVFCLFDKIHTKISNLYLKLNST